MAPAGTADNLLREMVEQLEDRPYQAIDLNGPFTCIFCGAINLVDDEPEHDAGCIWPRVLLATGWKPGAPPRPRRVGRPANEG